MNREAYGQLIDEDLGWLLQQHRSLERDHVEQVLQWARLIGPGKIETADDAMRLAISILAELLDIHNQCDEQRLREHAEAEDEAKKWQAEGDMYGWNFHQGWASGLTTASIIFDRVRRALTPGDKTYPART